MNSRGFRSLPLVFLVLIGLLAVAPAAQAGEPGREATAFEIESLFQQLLDSNVATPVYTEHGGGLSSLSITLEPEARERLLAAMRSGDADAKAATFFALAAGQQLTSPANASTCINAALSNQNLSYNYWVVVLNLGNQGLVRSTRFKLTGPGKKFDKSFNVTYGSSSIWIIWYNPAFGVGTSGVYTFQPSVTGASSLTTKSFAIVP
jgi:hypothetical protein